ncbi:MAG: NAD(P)H-hydrate epimerase, partial [Pseudomonadota bacterium]
MTELLTAAQMRAIEQAAIESGAVTGLELMERAGRGVVEAIFEEWPELATTSHRAVVLCGPGNNGGDGFVVARLLKEWGWEVEVFLYGDPDKLPPDARVNYERWGEMGEVAALPNNISSWSYDLILDALFGTGLRRGLSFEDRFGNLLPEWDLRSEDGCPRIVAVDVPSGLCSDSGKSLEGDCLWADLTVSFHTHKVGHHLATGPFCSGKVVRADIGLKHKATELVLEPYMHVRPVEVAAESMVKHIVRSGYYPKDDPFGRPTHKYTHGHALILSGGPGKGGAARLAARGALRIGAGLVTVGCPPEALPETAARLDAVMCRAVADADALARTLEDERLNALCLGPGLGVGEGTRGLVASALATRRATVLDADALTSFADTPQTLFDLLHPRCVLTPHAGEFARLFPDIAEQ